MPDVHCSGCPGHCYSRAYQAELSHAAKQIVSLTEAVADMSLRILDLEARIQAQGQLLTQRNLR